MATTSNKAGLLVTGKLSSVIPLIRNFLGTFHPECMGNTDWPLVIRASWLRKSIEIPRRLTNPRSFLSRTADPVIRVGVSVNMTGKAFSTTMR